MFAPSHFRPALEHSLEARLSNCLSHSSKQAARAGEAGKGFAVVAEEVGNLAQMSGSASKEISDMLTASIHRVEQIVSHSSSQVEILISNGRAKIDEGTQIARGCGVVLSDIVGSVAEVAQLSDLICRASQEQATGAEEISKAVVHLNQNANDTTVAAEEASSAAEALFQQSKALYDITHSLGIAILGEAKAS